jgi:hypothetical protein
VFGTHKSLAHVSEITIEDILKQLLRDEEAEYGMCLDSSVQVVLPPIEYST